MKPTRRPNPTIEQLESRIAPAGLITISPGGHSATWDDVDGDKITLTVTKGELTEALFTTDQTPATGLLVNALDLTDAAFKGASVKLKATRDPLTGGDGAVHLGYLNASGHGLGTVNIQGDLGRIDAGDPNLTPTTPKAIGALKVLSLGMMDGTTLPPGVTQTSEIVGKVGAIKVRGSVQGILFNVTGGAAGSIASLTIGGSLIGTGDADSGQISTSGKIGPIVIGGDIAGGAGQHSGSILAGGRIASLMIGGSIYGGRSENPSTDGTGVVRSEQKLGPVKVVGGVFGGTQQESGLIFSAGDAATVDIGGGLVGGSAGTTSGAVLIGGNVVAINVGGDVVGGAALESGVIRVAGKAGTISVGGALTGGSANDSGSIQLGTISDDAVGGISIGSDLTGGAGERAGTIVVAGKARAVAIGGAIRGATGEQSGALLLRSGAGSVVIGADVSGSTGENSGSVSAEGPIGLLSIGGSLLGGTADQAGSIITSGRLGSLSIAGSVVGGDLASGAGADLAGSGLIEAARVGLLSIGGSVRTGQDYNATFQLVNNAAIRVLNNVGSLKIGGSIEGRAEAPVFITARGVEAQVLNQTEDVAFGSITIGGAVRFASILAGFDTTADVALAAVNPDAQIGAVIVGGDWVASDLAAGAAWNEDFGNGRDKKAPGVNNPNIIARIASVRVAGEVVGTAGEATDHYGIVAQQIESLKVGRAANKVLLNDGWRNDNDPATLRYNLAGTLDVRVFEFA